MEQSETNSNEIKVVQGNTSVVMIQLLAQINKNIVDLIQEVRKLRGESNG